MLDPLGSAFSKDSVIIPISQSSIGDVITETPIRPSQPSKKRWKESQASALTHSIEECDVMLKKTIEDQNDEDSLHCRSIIPMMGELPKRQKRLAEIKISQLLYDITFYFLWQLTQIGIDLLHFRNI